jgi:hypothetical protein
MDEQDKKDHDRKQAMLDLARDWMAESKATGNTWFHHQVGTDWLWVALFSLVLGPAFDFIVWKLVF